MDKQTRKQKRRKGEIKKTKIRGRDYGRERRKKFLKKNKQIQ
jgi:hypothetical protein